MLWRWIAARIILVALIWMGTGACEGMGDTSRKEAVGLLNQSALFTPGKNTSRVLRVLGGFSQCGSSQTAYPREVVEVTGISEVSESERLVEFTWDWKREAFSKEERRCFAELACPDGTALAACEAEFTTESHCGSTGTCSVGTATFRRYDDGWRVVAVEDDGF